MTDRLLETLKTRANDRGLVLAREPVLCEALRVSREALASALRTLEREGAVSVLSPLPYLVLSLKKWPGKRANAGDSARSAYSYSKLFPTKRLQDSYRQPGHESSSPGQGDLLREILSTLGETDTEGFRRALQHYSPEVIRTALERVRRARGIRKSRTALFRHLLPRLAGEEPHRS